MKLSRQLEGGPFKWGGRSWEDAASKAKIGDHFLDAEVLWPRALSKYSAQRVKATKHTWESHNSGQPAVTAVLRWDCKHCSIAPLEAKRGEARPLPSVGLPSLNSKSPAVQAEQGALSDIRQTEEKPELSFTHAHLRRLQNFSGKSLSLLLGKEGMIYGRYTENKRTVRNRTYWKHKLCKRNGKGGCAGPQAQILFT